MGAADGPVFAPTKPGSKPFPWTDAPCKCPECQPGEGLNFSSGRILGELVKVITNRWCSQCCHGAVVTSTRTGEGSWLNTCDELHVWKTWD